MSEEIKTIVHCRVCPFYGRDMDGIRCYHPQWKDVDLYGAYDSHIMSDSMPESVPSKCPLRKEPHTMKIELGEILKN